MSTCMDCRGDLAACDCEREETPAWWRDPMTVDALATGARVALACIALLAIALSPLWSRT
jgi:hypothetical protein